MDKRVVGTLLGIAGILLWFMPWTQFSMGEMEFARTGSHVGGIAYELTGLRGPVLGTGACATHYCGSALDTPQQQLLAGRWRGRRLGPGRAMHGERYQSATSNRREPSLQARRTGQVSLRAEGGVSVTHRYHPIR